MLLICSSCIVLSPNCNTFGHAFTSPFCSVGCAGCSLTCKYNQRLTYTFTLNCLHCAGVPLRRFLIHVRWQDPEHRPRTCIQRLRDWMHPDPVDLSGVTVYQHHDAYAVSVPILDLRNPVRLILYSKVVSTLIQLIPEPD